MIKLKRREGSNKALGSGAIPADFLVCFPTRAHLTLMPKPVCSPARPNSEPSKRHLQRIKTRAATSSVGGPGSPLVWAKDNQIRCGGPEMSEPTSPKVTCAGQIKVRHRSATGCRNWQSVMEEIERIHNRGKRKKKASSSSSSSSSWVEAFGFKKDVTNFLTCLRNIKFDFRCFGSFPEHDISSDDDEDEEDQQVYDEDYDNFNEVVETHDLGGKNNISNDHEDNNDNDNNNNNAVFSKWFMVLQEENNQSNNSNVNKKLVKVDENDGEEEEEDEDEFVPAAPPPNALLLMRCRSAPAKSWLEENILEMKEEKTRVVEEEKSLMKKKRETLAIVMKYDTDFYKLSSDIAQETWVVGEFKDPFSRSRSSRR